jgi:hypothetical protein
MSSLTIPGIQKKRLLVVGLALAVLAALMIPQLSWADHASDHPYSQYDDPAIVSTSDADGDWQATQTLAAARRYAQGSEAEAWFLGRESSETGEAASCADWRAARRYAQGPEAEAWFLAQDQAGMAVADSSPFLCLQ